MIIASVACGSILANQHNTVLLYIGMTNDLERRVCEHRAGEASRFTEKYNTHKLVHVEEYTEVQDAIRREKQLKNWRRAWKEELIRERNPDFEDLSVSWRSTRSSSLDVESNACGR